MKYKNKQSTSTISRKGILTVIAAGIVLTGAIVGGVFLFTPKSGQPHRGTSSETPRDEEGRSTQRNADEQRQTKELAHNPDKKQQAPAQTDRPAEATASAENGKRKAYATVTNVGIEGDAVEASGFISTIAEEGGQCKFVFSQKDRRVVKNSSGLANPSSTTCRTVRFAKSELGSGTWAVTLEYDSPGVQGNSLNTMEIQL